MPSAFAICTGNFVPNLQLCLLVSVLIVPLIILILMAHQNLIHDQYVHGRRGRICRVNGREIVIVYMSGGYAGVRNRRIAN